MVDQYLLPHNIIFHLELKKYPTGLKKLAMFIKSYLFVAFLLLSSRIRFFDIIYLDLQKDFSKNKVITNFQMYLICQKHLKFCSCTSQNCNFYKAKSFGTFWLGTLASSIKLFKKINQKMKSIKIVKDNVLKS